MIVNNSKSFVDEESGVHTNNIEGTWSALKQSILYRHRHDGFIGGNLAEYVWRRKNKETFGKHS